MVLQTPVLVISRMLSAVALLACIQVVCASGTVKLPGTYSSLAYHAESGDLIGYEVRLIPTNQGTKAVVQVAEGDAGRIYIVDIVEASGMVQFDVPLASGLRSRFNGKITHSGLKGTITHHSGEKEDLFLKRTTSYWEQ